MVCSRFEVLELLPFYLSLPLVNSPNTNILHVSSLAFKCCVKTLLSQYLQYWQSLTLSSTAGWKMEVLRRKYRHVERLDDWLVARDQNNFLLHTQPASNHAFIDHDGINLYVNYLVSFFLNKIIHSLRWGYDVALIRLHFFIPSTWHVLEIKNGHVQNCNMWHVTVLYMYI